jgi:hypothetical protein
LASTQKETNLFFQTISVIASVSIMCNVSLFMHAHYLSHELSFSGPFVPGCADLMTEYSPDGCFIRLYYPTSLSHIKVDLA